MMRSRMPMLMSCLQPSLAQLVFPDDVVERFGVLQKVTLATRYDALRCDQDNSRTTVSIRKIATVCLFRSQAG